MSTYRSRVLAGRRGALLTHPSDSVSLDTFDDVGSGQVRRELHHFDAEEAFLETSVDKEIYVEDSRGISGVHGGMGLLRRLRTRTGGKMLVQNNPRQVRAIRSRSARVPQVRWRGGDGGVCAHGRHPCSRPSDDGEFRR